MRKVTKGIKSVKKGKKLFKFEKEGKKEEN